MWLASRPLCMQLQLEQPQVTCCGAHAQQLAALDCKALPHGHGLAVQGDGSLSAAHRHHCRAQVGSRGREQSGGRQAGRAGTGWTQPRHRDRQEIRASPFIPPESVRNLMDGPVRVISSAAARSSLPTSALARLHKQAAWGCAHSGSVACCITETSVRSKCSTC